MPKRERASRATWLNIALPQFFTYEDVGDHEHAAHIDYYTNADRDSDRNHDDMSFEFNQPEALRLSPGKIGDILFDCTDYSAIKATYCEWTTKGFDDLASEDLGFELCLKHAGEDEAMIKLSVARRLMARMKRGRKIEEFCAIHKDERSWRSERDAMLLLDQPLTNWEADELGFLLRAAMKAGVEKNLRLSTFEIRMRKAAGLPTTEWRPVRSEGELKETLFYVVFSGDNTHEAWSDAVDWTKYHLKVDEARDDLMDAMTDEEWERLKVEPRRCPFTLELPLVA